jgi:hypothetical protein
VCDLENLKNKAMTRVGSQRHKKKIIIIKIKVTQRIYHCSTRPSKGATISHVKIGGEYVNGHT